MCFKTLGTVWAAVSPVGGLLNSIEGANAQKKFVNFQAQEQQRQLSRQVEQERIAALQAENAKSAQFEQQRSSALAAVGASGIGDHISFFQGADAEAKKAYLRDVGTLRLNMTAEKASIADQVAVTEAQRRIGRYNADQSKVQAIGNFMQTMMQAVSFYGNFATPAHASSGGSSISMSSGGSGGFGSSWDGNVMHPIG